MTRYEDIIEAYAREEITYSEALAEMNEECTREIEECPFDITEEERDKLRRAKGLLEETRFNLMYKE